MSASMDSFTTSDASATSALRSMWSRLLWKDAREIVPIWITLLFAAVLCLIVTWLSVRSDYAHIAPLYISGHTFIALCSVITGVFLFASESENRTLHLLRNLPLPPKQIVWQKITLGAAGVVALSCVIAGITLLLAEVVQSESLKANSSFGFTAANVILLPLLYLVISSVSSMVTRSHFYGVLIAGVVCAGVIAVLEPTWLGARESDYSQRGQVRWLWVTLSILIGTAALVLRATAWVEEKIITGASLPIGDVKSNKTAAASLSSDTKNPFPILLWQSYRQSRVILASWFGLTAVGWIVILPLIDFLDRYEKTPHDILTMLKTMATLLWMFGTTILFASSIFLNDKHRGNYLFFQQNRERPRWFWLSRVLPFCGIALLLTLIWNFLIFDLGSIFPGENIGGWGWDYSLRRIELASSMTSQAASQSVLVALLVLFGIIGIGQYFSMFVRNPVLAFVFTGVVSVVFALLTTYVVFVNESVFLYLVPFIASVYWATWWRSKSWLATTPSIGDFLKPIIVPVIVTAIGAAAFVHHRATEFGDVRLDAQNYAQYYFGNVYDDADSGTGWGWETIEFGTEAQRQEAAKLYREAIELFSNGKNLDLSSYVPIQSLSPMKLSTFVSSNQKAIDNILEAAEIPVCAPFLSSDPEQRCNEIYGLRMCALLNSQHQLNAGNLSDAKQSIDAYDRLLQRTPRPATDTRWESGYYALLIAWADHPNQKLAEIKSAIAQLEGAATDIGAKKAVSTRGRTPGQDSAEAQGLASIYREFGGEQAFMNLQYELADLQEDNENHELANLKQFYRIMFWEYQRLTKVGQLRALHQYNYVQQKNAIEAERNDRLFSRDARSYPLETRRFTPPIPVDEDRMGGNFHYASSNYWMMREIATNVTWRRYALLRLGLAAYKIEHGEYPEKLTQLAPYYQFGLPITTDGMMFAWFKDGLGFDLIDATYEDVDSDEVDSATVIVEGSSPLLLPFSLDPSKRMPDPVNYDGGKMGIDLDRITEDYATHVPPLNNFSYYPMNWSVGER